MSEISDYQRLIHASRYARWLEDEGRRETWPETVRRYVNFWDSKIDIETKAQLIDGIEGMEVVRQHACPVGRW